MHPLIRTTIRLPQPLKKSASAKALELDMSFQELVHRALEQYLRQQSTQKAHTLVFHSHDIGTPLDNLTREDIYAD